jgi:hypothetical protein
LQVPERNKCEEAAQVLFEELIVEVSAYARDDDLVAVNKELTTFANRLIPYFFISFQSLSFYIF